jgi:hemolysin activation/secretion protein
MNAQYRGYIAGQYSPDVLFGSEEIFIGSDYSVRGYKTNSLSSNTGAYWRNDLTIHYFSPWPWLSRISPFIALDGGLVRDRNVATDKYESLKGWAAGFQAADKHWSARVVYSWPIDAPDYFDQAGEELALSFSLNF